MRHLLRCKIMLKILVAILTISLVLLYVSLAVIETNGQSFFVNKSNNTIDFFREAGTRFWEFEWIQGSDRDRVNI